MRVVIAPDSFKGSLSAPEAARAISRGWRRVFPDSECLEIPVADGGEGTARTMSEATGGVLMPARVRGPLGDMVDAMWARCGDGTTAVVDLAAAAGLGLVPQARRDPSIATTFGVGELVVAAGEAPGIRRLIIGLGGSATNDGGAGLLHAVGWRLLDAQGSELPAGGAALSRLARIEAADRDPWRAIESVVIACDVSNPLCGEDGASAVFGPQKGADPDTVARLDAALANLQRVAGVRSFAGAGAAGGAAYGLRLLFPEAQVRSGIDIVLDAVGFDNRLVGADLVLTGEGRLDLQTGGGKAVSGVVARASRAGIPVVALVGGFDPSIDPISLGVAAMLPVVPGPVGLVEAIRHAEMWLADAAERAARWIGVGRSLGA